MIVTRGTEVLLALIAVVALPACKTLVNDTGDVMQSTFGGRPAEIGVHCARPLTQPAAPGPSEAPVPVAVRQAAVNKAFRVKTLFDDGTPNPRGMQFTLLESANATLATDVRALLGRQGYGMQDGVAARAGVDAAVADLSVFIKPPKGLESSFSVRTQAVILVSLSRGGQVLWTRPFYGQSSARIAVATTSAYQRIVDDAYCGCLEALARTIGTPEFRHDVEGDAGSGIQAPVSSR